MQNIITSERARSLMVHLGQVTECFYHEKKSSVDDILSQLSPEASRLLREYAQEHKLDLLERKDIEEAIQGLISAIDALEKVTITSAVDLSTEFLSKIHAWLTENVKKDIVIDTFIDRKILAGTILWWKGSYIDLSLRSRI